LFQVTAQPSPASNSRSRLPPVTMTQLNQIDNIQALFRTQQADMPRLSTPTEKPNYSTLKRFQEAIEENAMSVPSNTTDLGHLALVISAADFTTANRSPFIQPSNPGEQPEQPALAGTTRDQTTEVIAMLPFTAAENIRLFNHQQQEFLRFRNTRTALKNQILNSIEDKYICSLKHSRTKYATITPLQLLDHLWTTYGKIDQADQSANEKRMRAQWNPPMAIESLFEQLQEGQTFAAKGDETISDSQLMRWAYENLLSTGLFDRDCARWRKKPATEQTWANFKTFFTIAEDDRSKNATTAEATFTANQVQQLIQQELAAFIQQENQSNAENIPPPPASNPPAQEQSANAITAADIQKMINSAINQTPPPPREGLRQRNPNHQNKPHPKAQALEDGTPVTYCWTHGVTRNLHHCSKTCSRKAENHKDDATYDNRMGGSEIRQKSKK
jgi:hypothetical protein